MNGYVIFNAVMTFICIYNLCLIMREPDAPVWSLLLLLFFVVVCAVMTGLVYTPGDN